MWILVLRAAFALNAVLVVYVVLDAFQGLGNRPDHYIPKVVVFPFLCGKKKCLKIFLRVGGSCFSKNTSLGHFSPFLMSIFFFQSNFLIIA